MRLSVMTLLHPFVDFIGSLHGFETRIWGISFLYLSA
jgi:hypothetical protein